MLRSWSKDQAFCAEAEFPGGMAQPRDTDIAAILRTLLSRLDSEQARAFRLKMAELDAERQRSH